MAKEKQQLPNLTEIEVNEYVSMTIRLPKVMKGEAFLGMVESVEKSIRKNMAKGKGARNHYSESEIELLKQGIKKGRTAEEMASTLGREVHAVGQKMWSMKKKVK